MVSKDLPELQKLADALAPAYERIGERIAAELKPIEEAIGKIGLAFEMNHQFASDQEGGYCLEAAKVGAGWRVCASCHSLRDGQYKNRQPLTSVALPIRVLAVNPTRSEEYMKLWDQRHANQWSTKQEELRRKLEAITTTPLDEFVTSYLKCVEQDRGRLQSIK